MEPEEFQERFFTGLLTGRIKPETVVDINAKLLVNVIGLENLCWQDVDSSENIISLRPLLNYNRRRTDSMFWSPIEARPYKPLSPQFSEYLKVTYHSRYGLICPPRFSSQQGEYTRIFVYVDKHNKLHFDNGRNAEERESPMRRWLTGPLDASSEQALKYQPALVDIPFKACPEAFPERVIIFTEEEWKQFPGRCSIGFLHTVGDYFGRMVGDKVFYDSIQEFNRTFSQSPELSECA